MPLKPQIKKIIIYSSIIIVALTLFSFVETKQQNKLCRHIDVLIEEESGNYFISSTDVVNLLTNSGRDPIVGAPQKKIHLKNLESRIKTNKFVKNCQISSDLHGDLLIHINQWRPIARVINASGQDIYINENGDLLPMSERYTARVVTIISTNAQKTWLNAIWLRKPENLPYLQLLQFIDKDKFWKAQVAEIDVNSDGEINFYPQIGKQIIEFGLPENEEIISEKFKKLSIFYKTIIPKKTWNTYSRVNVAFKNQIVCE